MSSSNNKRTILVIDDDQDMNDLICAVLQESGYHAVSAYSGEDGIESALQKKPDLVLLDIMLPQMNGIEVCRAISTNERTRGVPIIMLTIKRELSSKLASYIAGARRYITKPFGIEELIGEIKKTLRQNDILPDTEFAAADPRD